MVDSPPTGFRDGTQHSGPRRNKMLQKTLAMNNRIKKHMQDLKRAKRSRAHSIDAPRIPPSVDSTRMSVKEFQYIKSADLNKRNYYGVGYDGIKSPMVYDDLEQAFEKFRLLGRKKKSGLRVHEHPVQFDEAQFYSMYGPSALYDRTWTYEWQAESAWLLRKLRGEDQDTDVSTDDEATPSHHPGASSSKDHGTAVTPSLNVQRVIRHGAQSELGRTERRKKKQKDKAKKRNETDLYLCPSSDRDVGWLSNNEDVYIKTPNPRYVTA